MDFGLSEEQRLFADTNRRFLEESCDLEKVRSLADTASGFEADWWRRAADLGWVGMMVDEEAGGLGLGGEGVRYLGLVAEEMGRWVSPGPLVPTSVVASTLSKSVGGERRAEALSALVAGETTAAWCYAEEGRGFRADAIAMTAERAAGGGFVLNGVKTPVEAAAQAAWLLVTVRVGQDLGQFLVPTDTPGVILEPLRGLDLVRRQARVRFADVRLDAAALIGSTAGAGDDVERQLQLAFALYAAESAGAADRVLEFTLEWAFDRFSFGRPLASYQALKHRFADMKCWLEACHATASAALRAIAASAADAPRLARVAKAYVGDHAPEIVQDCIQMHGGLGVTWEHDIHLYLRRVATNRMLYGEPREHRAAIADLSGF